MKKKSIWTIVSIAATAVFLSGMATLASAKAIELTYANFFPPVPHSVKACRVMVSGS